MNYQEGRWKRMAATGAVLAVSAAASVYLIRTLRDRQAQRERESSTGRAPTAGRPLGVIRGGAGEG
jgi:hypothetical protein